MKDITRVVLIGDAPPHFERKGTKLLSHNFTLTTDYKEQVCAVWCSIGMGVR